MNLWALSSLGFLMQKCLNRFFHVKAVVAAFNQEKALVGAFSVIVQLRRLFVCSTNHHTIPCYTSYWGTIIVTILTPVYCVLTSAVPGVPARCGDYIALEHLSLALIGTHHVHISGGGCSLDKPETTLGI